MFKKRECWGVPRPREIRAQWETNAILRNTLVAIWRGWGQFSPGDQETPPPHMLSFFRNLAKTVLLNKTLGGENFN